MTQYLDGADRFHSKRAAGLSATRFDGTRYDPEIDRQAAAAEQYAAESLGCKFNDAILPGGDGGFDFKLELEVEVYWLGLRDGLPRSNGHLIINPLEPHRFADIYIVIRGSIATGFFPVGWTSHSKLILQEQKDFGYGMRYAMPVSGLWSVDTLKALKR